MSKAGARAHTHTRTHTHTQVALCRFLATLRAVESCGATARVRADVAPSVQDWGADWEAIAAAEQESAAADGAAALG